ncbi:MAG: metalloregulator ArsR/SmtB family transcription factor [Deltaproteobacteria bacterium]|nr:metalloregulator ArsR/SmtB family transcription factor [Deltaproteobacteria bacterium]
MTDLASSVDLLGALADPTRMRLLCLLTEHELTVAELVDVTRATQSRVSAHLSRLREAGLAQDRRDGTSTCWRADPERFHAGARTLWAALRPSLADAALAGDRERCRAVLRAHRAAPGSLESWAGELEKHYSPGRTWEALARALTALVSLGDVLDAGGGDGAVAQMLAPRARTLTLLDRSDAMVAAAARRLHALAHVRAVPGDVEQMPLPDRAFDQVLLLNVLTDVAHPDRALRECARVLRPGGRLLVVTLAAHAHRAVAAAYGHTHPGFRPAALARWLRGARLTVDSCAVTSRETRAPRFEVLTAVAHRGSR